jgi:hypothetical protein
MARVILIGSGKNDCAFTNIAQTNFRGYRLHTNVQACRSAPLSSDRFVDRQLDQLKFYSPSERFRLDRRLTGFGGARNIVRIRTKHPAAKRRDSSGAADHAAS